jgi:hypothetical protein
VRNYSKLLAAAIAALVMWVFVGSAAARSLEITHSEKGWQIAWSPLRLEAAEAAISCFVTFEGSFERSSYAKVAGTRIGRVTEAIVANGGCESGHMTILRETLPWEVAYNSFTGTLPVITSLRLNIYRASITAEAGAFSCLFRNEVNRPFRAIGEMASGGAVTSFRADETAAIETTGGFLCEARGAGHFSGSGTPSVRPETIVVRLI